MEDERDIVVFSDDDGNEFELEVIDYFDHEDQEYAVLVDPATCECGEDECDCETEVYIMKVVENGGRGQDGGPFGHRGGAPRADGRGVRVRL